MSEAQGQGKPIRDWLQALACGDDSAHHEALAALTRMSEAAVPDLIEALKDDDWQVRNQAAVALGVIGPGAKAAAGPLSDLLQDEDKYLRGHGATALGKLGPDARSAVRAGQRTKGQRRGCSSRRRHGPGANRSGRASCGPGAGRAAQG